MHRNTGIFKIYAGHSPLVFLCTPETAEPLLSSYSNLRKSLIYNNLHPWLGPDGLLTSHGETWRVHRKVLTPAFHFQVLENFLPIINEQAEMLIDQLGQLDHTESVNLFPILSKCALGIICETAMGLNVHAKENKESVSEFQRNTELCAKLFIKRAMQPWTWINFIYAVTKNGALSSKVLHSLHRFTTKVIQERQKETVVLDPSPVKEANFDVPKQVRQKRPAFLDLLLEHFRKGVLSCEDLRQEVDTFMFAGHDTSAQTLTWTLFALGIHPEIQRKVHKELDRVFGNDKIGDVTKADVGDLVYLDSVLKVVQIE